MLKLWLHFVREVMEDNLWVHVNDGESVISVGEIQLK